MSSIFISVTVARPPQLTCGKDNLCVIFLLTELVDIFDDMLQGHGERKRD